MWDAEVPPKAENEFRVAVLGDSFTSGLGAGYGERFTEVVEARNRRINVLNFGVTAFSPIQYMQQLDKVFALKADYVVVALCLGNDLYENVSPNPYKHAKPFAKLAADGVGLEAAGYPLPQRIEAGSDMFGATSPSRIVAVMNMMADQRSRGHGAHIDPTLFYVPLDKLPPDDRKKVEDAYKLNEMILGAMKTRIDTAIGPGRFAVLLVPTRWDIEGNIPHAGAVQDPVAIEVLASLARLGIPPIDGRTAISAADFWKNDIHWRPSGHRKIGDLLAEFLTSAQKWVAPGPIYDRLVPTSAAPITSHGSRPYD